MTYYSSDQLCTITSFSVFGEITYHYSSSLECYHCRPLPMRLELTSFL